MPDQYAGLAERIAKEVAIRVAMRIVNYHYPDMEEQHQECEARMFLEVLRLDVLVAAELVPLLERLAQLEGLLRECLSPLSRVRLSRNPEHRAQENADLDDLFVRIDIALATDKGGT